MSLATNPHYKFKVAPVISESVILVGEGTGYLDVSSSLQLVGPEDASVVI